MALDKTATAWDPEACLIASDALGPSGPQHKGVFNKMQKEDDSDEMRFHDDTQACKLKILPGTSWAVRKNATATFWWKIAATKQGRADQPIHDREQPLMRNRHRQLNSQP